MSDKELIDDILQHNSQKAFEELVNRYQPMVTKTCLGFVNSLADAEDLAQEVFIEVFESLKGFRSEAKISTWIYRIAVNKSLNQVRKQKRDRIFRSIENFFTSKNDVNEPLQVLNRDGENADSNLERSENKRMLKQAINALPENQRIAFILSKYQELSYKEIADVMGVSLSSVESLLFRAKSNLQGNLKKEMAK
ncbi:MAG: sigma-70 family RNA polymerase sigma factor [Tenuifilaceae bacterium]|jgi:RNA polymerase sigma-70 factor (ECF subfamily)|nr:sigma-70 family RNA polymerase sigma factor [Tenuifilaceae bacterium]